jgi:hypothetical protein
MFHSFARRARDKSCIEISCTKCLFETWMSVHDNQLLQAEQTRQSHVFAFVCILVECECVADVGDRSASA